MFFISSEDRTEKSFEKSMRIIQGDGKDVQWCLQAREIVIGDGRAHRSEDRLFGFTTFGR